MVNVTSGITRPDTSKSDLNTYKSQGYVTVVFVANMESDPNCDYLNGNVYSIDELLALDNPIYRIAHPNCRCKFDAFGRGKSKIPEQTHTPTGPAPTQTPTQTPTTTPTPTTLPNQGQPQEGQKTNPWYKKWMPWLFRDKKSNFRERILKRAKYAEQVRTTRELLLSGKKRSK